MKSLGCMGKANFFWIVTIFRNTRFLSQEPLTETFCLPHSETHSMDRHPWTHGSIYNWFV